ncbi:AGC/DMPK/ROCK protein kinase, partial [Aphelenchoides avenae]
INAEVQRARDNSASDEQRAALERQLAASQNQLREVTRRLEAERLEIEQKTQQVRRLEEELRNRGQSEDHVQRLELEIREANERLRRMTEVEERAKALRAELMQQIDDHTERLKQLEEQLRQSQEQERMATAQAQKLRNDVEDERERAQRHKDQVQSLTDQLRDLRNDLEETSKRECHLKIQLTKLNEEKMIVEKSGMDLTERDRSLSESRSQISRLEYELESVAKRADNLKKELETVCNQKGHLEDRMQQIVKELAAQREAEQCSQSEVWRLRSEKNRLESNIHGLLNDRKLLEVRLNELTEQLETDQNIAQIFKLELQARKEEAVDKDRRLQCISGLEKQLDEAQNQLQSERFARQMAEENLKDLEHAKEMLDDELQQIMERHRKEIDAKNNSIEFLNQREAELTGKIRTLQEELGKMQHRAAHQSNGDHLQPRGSLVSAQSTISLLSSHSGGRSGDLESMTREQLIAQCKREREMKDQVVQKLAYIGQMKGISDKEDKPSRGNKKKNEEKRIRDLVEQQLEQERRMHRLSMEKMQESLNFMQEQLYDEQKQREALESELFEYKAFAE